MARMMPISRVRSSTFMPIVPVSSHRAHNGRQQGHDEREEDDENIQAFGSVVERRKARAAPANLVSGFAEVLIERFAHGAGEASSCRSVTTRKETERLARLVSREKYSYVPAGNQPFAVDELEQPHHQPAVLLARTFTSR